MNTTVLLCIIGSYLIGAIPFGLLLSRGSGVDIRSQGSKNIGATNVARLVGKKMGALTLGCDILKGFLPMWGIAHLLQGEPGYEAILGSCGAALVSGHMFSVYLRFKGGKGVATALGIFLYLAPTAVLGCMAVFACCVGLTGFVSLGSLFGSLSMLLWLFMLKAPAWKLWLAVFIVFMIWVKHWQNIGRLLSGTEKSWRKKAES